MSGRIPRQFIDELLVRVDIVDVIDSHIPIKKMGANIVPVALFTVKKPPALALIKIDNFSIVLAVMQVAMLLLDTHRLFLLVAGLDH